MSVGYSNSRPRNLQYYTGSLTIKLFDFSKPWQKTKRQRTFEQWLQQVTPRWHWGWQHLAYIRSALERVTNGEVKRLMLFIPPRHGKSEMTTVRYPVWRLQNDPELRVIIGAYNQILANKFSRKARRIAEYAGLPLSPDRVAVEDWETNRGGGVRAVGVGGGITGQGGNLIVIDDPVKSREEANSPTYRERVWDWYTDDLYTRLEPGGAIILIMTRWHVDDLAGRILASEDAPNWTIVKLPAEAKQDDPWRQPGEALCPERYPLAELARIKMVLGSTAYQALYQQEPVPETGNLAQREWFRIVEAAPAQGRRVRYWDFAATSASAASQDPDYTVGLELCEHEGMYYVLKPIRERIGPGAVENLVRQTAVLDGQQVSIGFEREPGSAGKLFTSALIRELAGWNVRAVPATGDKVTRAMPWLAQAEAGNVCLVRGAWNVLFLDEVTSFPLGVHDDMVDAMSGAFAQLSRGALAARSYQG